MKKLLLLVVALVSLFGEQRASSLTINLIFTGGTPPTNIIGNHWDITNVFRAGADFWELAIRDNHVVTIEYGWESVGGGIHYLITQGGMPNREIRGRISINNDNDLNHLNWYIDPTPYSCSEATNYVTSTVNLGFGPINAGRNYLYPATTQHIDLLTVVTHEQGHALGMSYVNFSFIDECADGDIDVTGGPYPWIVIPMQRTLFTDQVISHIDYIGDCLMSGSFYPGSRMMPTSIDIIALAQLSGFTQLNLDLLPVLSMSTPFIGTDGKWKVTLSWLQPLPTPQGQEWVVQSCADIAQGSWSKVNKTITNDNGKYSMIVNVSGNQKFFRLKLQ